MDRLLRLEETPACPRSPQAGLLSFCLSSETTLPEHGIDTRQNMELPLTAMHINTQNSPWPGPAGAGGDTDESAMTADGELCKPPDHSERKHNTVYDEDCSARRVREPALLKAFVLLDAVDRLSGGPW